MRRLIYTVALTLGLAGVCACGSKEETKRDPKVRDLYVRSLKLGRVYSDSILHAPDSAEVERLSKAYDNAVTRLNYNYQPDLSLEISEGENDTLTKVTMRFVALRDSILDSFAVKQKISQDSVSTSQSS